MNDQTTETPRHVHGGYEYPLDCPVCALEVVRKERDEAKSLLREALQIFPRRWGFKTEELGNRIEQYLKGNE